MNALSWNEISLVCGGAVSAADEAEAESMGEETGKSLVKIAEGVLLVAGIIALL